MSIATEISRLQGAKADIKTAIEGKGVSVPSSALLDSYPDYIDAIQQGGGDEEHTYTGHVDTAGLTALGWDSDDIQWLQDHVWWDAEDDAYWAVSEANLAFGPNGATPLTWANRATVQYNPNVRYLPKMAPTGFSYAFNEYPFLIAIPTHGWSIGSNASFIYTFANCTNLVSVGDLGELVTTAIVNMSYAFINCYKLKTPGDLSGWDVANVTNFSNMFTNCKSLLSVGDLSNWDTRSASNISFMFSNCHNLEFIGELSGWDTSSITNISGLFSNCYAMRSIGGISAWDVGGITALYYIFDVNISRTVIDISGWDLSNLTNSGSGAITGGFSGCTCTTRLVLGPKFFAGSSTTFYLEGLRSWSHDSVYESLYTNQTLRDGTSPAKTIRLYSKVYDTLTAQDISDITSKNFTLARI